MTLLAKIARAVALVSLAAHAFGACPTTGPTPLAPMNGATTSAQPVTFQWSVSSGATGYQLFLQNGSDDFQDIADTTSTSVQRLVPTGANNWYVVAKFA